VQNIKHQPTIKAMPDQKNATLSHLLNYLQFGVAISKMLSEYAGSVLLDEKFTEPNFQEGIENANKETQPLILHMATHASFGTSEKDTFILSFKGRIGLIKLKSLDLRNISLFTLSACETAANDGRSGKGLAVVAEASGALSVMGSLWSVSDTSTSVLMRQFYTNLKSGMGKAQALQQAQVSLIQGQTTVNTSTENRGGLVPFSSGRSTPTSTTFNDPFYWAPFILIGNWR
jgi:CHAT domain-containing protein